MSSQQRTIQISWHDFIRRLEHIASVTDKERLIKPVQCHAGHPMTRNHNCPGFTISLVPISERTRSHIHDRIRRLIRLRFRQLTPIQLMAFANFRNFSNRLHWNTIGTLLPYQFKSIGCPNSSASPAAINSGFLKKSNDLPL